MKINADLIQADLAELGRHGDDVQRDLRGVQDWLKLDLPDPVRVALTAQQTQMQERLNLIAGLQDVYGRTTALLTTLVEHGYPELPAQTVADGVIDELEAREATIQSALSRFLRPSASALVVELGPEEPAPAAPEA